MFHWPHYQRNQHILYRSKRSKHWKLCYTSPEIAQLQHPPIPNPLSRFFLHSPTNCNCCQPFTEWLAIATNGFIIRLAKKKKRRDIFKAIVESVTNDCNDDHTIWQMAYANPCLLLMVDEENVVNIELERNELIKLLFWSVNWWSSLHTYLAYVGWDGMWHKW